MFTGIIQTQGKIISLTKKQSLVHLEIEMAKPFLLDLKTGASIAIDGTCLTVVSCTDTSVFFDAIEETLLRTTLGSYEIGQKVNIERAAKFGDEIGGHLLSGHVMGKGEIYKIERNVFTIQSSSEIVKYLFPKGYVAIDGISLTLVSVDKKNGLFSVHLIPETLARTTLGWKKEKSAVNIEVDALTQATVDTVEAVLQAAKS